MSCYTANKTFPVAFDEKPKKWDKDIELYKISDVCSRRSCWPTVTFQWTGCTENTLQKVCLTSPRGLGCCPGDKRTLFFLRCPFCRKPTSGQIRAASTAQQHRCELSVSQFNSTIKITSHHFATNTHYISSNTSEVKTFCSHLVGLTMAVPVKHTGWWTGASVYRYCWNLSLAGFFKQNYFDTNS